VDVSSTTLEARLGRAGLVQSFERSADGIAALAAFCKQHQVGFVAMEATGGYERLPCGLLWAAGVPAAIVNPRAVRRFAEAMGILEKTDRIDTGIIAWFAEVKRIVPQAPAGPAQQRLAALVTRLRQLTALRVAQSNQRRLVTDATVCATFDELLPLVNRQIRSLEAQIAQLIQSDPLWQQLDAAFRTLKGVADRSVAAVMAELPEIGTLSNKAAAKLVGLAPIARDSGKLNGKRPVRGGRSGIRTILFVIADLVRRYNPDFADCHRRLTQAGKPKKLIRVALARKLLVRLNAKARDVRCALAKLA
jgi:transposase